MPAWPHLLSFHLSSYLIIFYISHINSSTQHPQALFQTLHILSSFIINRCFFFSISILAHLQLNLILFLFILQLFFPFHNLLII
ncbi:hypothetical protein CROQUDRAFT_303757 [Cronartium quercuum f. sp. fusiforme G11]|uniref:Uncharacterized protein n=1 Tax=Cronartium quercuum f. sp. fusiforme G11 TaxID=708437 RepID=A0A9P6TER3_9BASI|nr:hypothetical protein CROQUDRAFT_303757 [Cronartium quercuum f. sp. fusiforme G11]